VTSFHSFGLWLKGTNASFLTLIPKANNLQILDVYKPISLVGSIYKIISKILANRLKEALSKIIDHKQSAYMENRGLLESTIVANEVLDDVKQNNKK